MSIGCRVKVIGSVLGQYVVKVRIKLWGSTGLIEIEAGWINKPQLH